MPSVYDLKPAFQRLLRPLAEGLARAGVSPNAVTCVALAGSLAGGAVLTWRHGDARALLLLPPWLFVRMALNAIDGMIARGYGKATPAGAVLNELGDVVSDLALYLPLALWASPSRWPVVLFAIAAALTEFCGVLGPMLGATRRYDGPMGKSDRAFVVGALALITYFAPAAGAQWRWVFGALALLCAATCARRIASELREVRTAREAAAR